MKNDETLFRFLAEPSDVNFGGKVHGGTVMHWIDQTAYSCAVNWSGKYCVTVYVGGIRFMRPIQIGDVVEVKAKLIYTHKTSMHFAVDIYAENPKVRKRTKTTHCIIVFVAVDEKGKTIEVPNWSPANEKEEYLRDYAVRLMHRRKAVENEMKEFLEE